jgi:hypothetical protein
MALPFANPISQAMPGFGSAFVATARRLRLRPRQALIQPGYRRDHNHYTSHRRHTRSTSPNGGPAPTSG